MRDCPGCDLPLVESPWRVDPEHYGGVRRCPDAVCGYSHSWSYNGDRVPALIGTTVMNRRVKQEPPKLKLVPSPEGIN